ncbi:MAG: hypothetical protein WC943_17050, partial [Elusimicrobiota bacterium]
MTILDADTRAEVKRRLSGLEGPVTLTLFKLGPGGSTSETFEDLALELARLTDKIVLRIFDFRVDAAKAREYGVDRAPALVVESPSGAKARYFGLPGGYEFIALLENIQDSAAGRAELSKDTRRK